MKHPDEPVNFSNLFSRCFHILREVMVKSCWYLQPKETRDTFLNLVFFHPSKVTSGYRVAQRRPWILIIGFNLHQSTGWAQTPLWNRAYLGIFKITSPPTNSSFLETLLRDDSLGSLLWPQVAPTPRLCSLGVQAEPQRNLLPWLRWISSPLFWIPRAALVNTITTSHVWLFLSTSKLMQIT